MTRRARTQFGDPYTAQHLAAAESDVWSIKTVLAMMPQRWDENHGVVRGPQLLPPPGTMPTDASSPGGLFDLLGSQNGARDYANPYPGLINVSAHATSSGVFDALTDHADPHWRGTRKTLTDSFVEIMLIGSHRLQLSHFAYRRMDSGSYDMPRTFDVSHMVDVDDVLTWQPLGRAQCADAAQPDRLAWCSPIAIAAPARSARFRFVPVSAWDGSTSRSDSRLAFAQFELYGTYTGPFGPEE